MFGYLEALDELKKRYTEGRVSALIGSGFSKNISSFFPLWDQLLADIVCEIYRRQPYNCSRQTCKRTRTSLKNEIHEIIKSEGYLNIIDRYISSKGYRESIETYIEEHIPTVNLTNNTINIQGRSINLTESDWGTHSKLLSGNWKNIYTTNYDSLLEDCAKRDAKYWNVVKAASELTLSDQQNIIKLHGSLKNNADEGFCFDGNHHHRYIVTRSDYKNYPTEHEAFTQLMKISLLQGTFCLIGFSGDDPNFISWVEWVRNVLAPEMRKNSPNKLDSFKIFLIAVGNYVPEKDKELFYKNHRIVVIPLRETTVLSAIKGNISDDNKTLINRFFDYLYQHSHMPSYQELWSNIYLSYREENEENKKIKENRNENNDQKIKFLARIKEETQRVVTYPLSISSILSELDKKEKLNSEDEEILIETLKHSPLLLGQYDKFKNGLNNPEITKLLNFCDAFQNPTKTPKNPINTYQKVLKLAFQLKFSELNQILRNWKTQHIDTLKKCVFLSIFPDERKILTDTLKKFINQESSIQERFYASEFLNYLDFSQRVSTEKYENLGLTGIRNFCHQLNTAYTKGSIDIKAYDDVDASSNIQQTILTYNEALHYLYLLFEIPIFNTKPRSKYLNDTVLFLIIKKLLEQYPFPCLFLSCSITDEEILKRIGQEISYSEFLHQNGINKIILTRILSAILDPMTPKDMVLSLIYISAELFVSVEPEVWEKHIKKIISLDLTAYFEYPFYSKAVWIFFEKALQSCQSEALQQKLLVYLLRHKEQSESFNNRFYFDNCLIKFSSLPHPKKVTKELREELNQFIAGIYCRRDFAILIHIKDFLTQQQLSLITEKVITVLKEDSSDFYSWRALVWVTNQTKKYQKEVIQAIINSKYLWAIGVENEKELSPRFILLSLLELELNFSSQDLLHLLEKLVQSFNRLKPKLVKEKVPGNEPFGPDYRFLLDEMYRFLRRHYKELLNLGDFLQFYKEFESYVIKCRGYSDLLEGLSSKDNRTLMSVSNEVRFLIRNDQISNEYIKLICSRLLLEVANCFVDCLDLIEKYLRKRSNNEIPQEIISCIEHILNKFSLEKLQAIGVDVPLASSILIEIAKKLNSLVPNLASTQKWLEIEESRRYHWIQFH